MLTEAYLKVKDYEVKDLFGIHLFCWNWKLFAESIVDKS